MPFDSLVMLNHHRTLPPGKKLDPALKDKLLVVYHKWKKQDENEKLTNDEADGILATCYLYGRLQGYPALYTTGNNRMQPRAVSSSVAACL